MAEHAAEVGLACSDLSIGRRELLDTVDRLRGTGVDVDLDLPQVVVIGPQSSGKSSVIQSISGVPLPRSSGTCTRCPTECRLSKSNGPWQCAVSLRIITDASGQPLGQARDEQFGDVITDRSEVADRLRRAQRAILNPHQPADVFLRGDNTRLPAADSLSFSQNSVVLHITSPDVADLSFCDLPGLIASVSSENGSDNDINLVKSLVTSYIKKPSCIILLTVACETDFENQGAHNLVKQFDPDGKRTIGVLTKPDRIQAGEAGSWTAFVTNEREPLAHNWYCVKQPSPEQLKSGITWSEARSNENAWFSTTSPWCHLEGRYQKNLRTSNLVEKLSDVLSDLIEKRLPQIHDELEKSITECRTTMARLPPPPSNPLVEISALLHRFTNDVSRHTAGVPVDDTFDAQYGSGLIQTIYSAQEKFRLAIRATAPEFRPYAKDATPSKSWTTPAFLKPEESCTAQNKDLIYIDEVMERARNARTRELPGNYPFLVQKTFIDGIIVEWRSPAKSLCHNVYNIVLQHIRRLVVHHFRSFGMGRLEQRIAAIMHQHLKSCLKRAEEKVDWLLSLEDAPFSLNTHYLSDYKAKFMVHYRTSRDKDRGSRLSACIDQHKHNPKHQTSPPAGVDKVLSGLAEIGLSGVKAEDLAKLLPSDDLEPAMVIMADVRAYFQVSYKRFVDVVPLAIDHEIVRGIERDLLEILYTDLDIHGPNGAKICQDFAEEHPHIADQRADLKRKLERLHNAGDELRAVAI